MEKDSEYVPPNTSAPSRVSYGSKFHQVLDKQDPRVEPDGRISFQSAVEPNKRNFLDSKYRETYQKSGDRTKLQKPALDHKHQYAALYNAYGEQTMEEREKGEKGLQRRPSKELYDAFKDAASDPDNLQVVMQDEHTKYGGNFKIANMPENKKREASSFYKDKLNEWDEYNYSQEEIDNFSDGTTRPKAAFPKKRTESKKEAIRRSERNATSKRKSYAEEDDEFESDEEDIFARAPMKLSGKSKKIAKSEKSTD